MVGPCLASFSYLLVAPDGRRQPSKFARICALSTATTDGDLYIYTDKLSLLPVIVINHTNNLTNRMAEQSSRSRFTEQEVLAFLDEEEDGMDDTFFPGSDEDLALNSDEEVSDAGEHEEVSNAGEDEEVRVAREDEEDRDAGERK